jgi:hypothetical protein
VGRHGAVDRSLGTRHHRGSAPLNPHRAVSRLSPTPLAGLPVGASASLAREVRDHTITSSYFRGGARDFREEMQRRDYADGTWW